MEAHDSPRYKTFSKKISCLTRVFVFISCSRQHTVANQRGKKFHVIGNTRSWLVVQLLAFISLIAKIKKTYLQNWVISTQKEYTNYSSHFKYKICLKIIWLIFFWRRTVSFNAWTDWLQLSAWAVSAQAPIFVNMVC